MNKLFEQIIFPESFVLGWNRENNDITFYIEVQLTEYHDHFEKVNYEKECGCFKLGRIHISNCSNDKGSISQSLSPSWNDSLGEYTEVADIEEFDCDENTIKIIGDEFEFACDFEAISLEIVHLSKFRL